MKKIIYTALALTLCLGAFAQDKPGVGINKKKVDKSAILDVAATNKGVLIPRIAINDVNLFGLEGDSKTESMLVFNATGMAAKGFYYWTTITYVDNGVQKTKQKWELITSESVLNEKITEVKKYVKDEITKITQVGVAGDLSYLVAFKPDAAGSSTGAFSYLVPSPPDANGNITYKQVDITLAELVSMSETKTYIRTEMHDIKDPKDATKTINVVKAYWYFNEQAVNEWLKVAGNDIKDVLDPIKGIKLDTTIKGVFKIDVIDAVNNNWSKLFEDNRKYIEEFLTTAEGNVYTKVIKDPSDPTGVKEIVTLVYRDSTGAEKEININDLETKTRIKKGTVGANGQVAQYNEAVEGALIDGQVIFRYAGEEKGKYDYLNITAEVKTALTHETVKQELTKILSVGGSVYYGEIVVGDGKNVLYRIVVDPITGVETKVPIDISENIIHEINTNETIVEKIKEKTKVIVESGTNVPTGEIINGYIVYKGTATFRVNNTDGYDSELAQNTFISAKPMKYVVDDKTKKGSWVENKTDKFGRLVKASILDVNGQVVLTTVTEVKVVGDNEFTFAFGVGNSYYPLINGSYEVIFEYLGTTKQQ